MTASDAPPNSTESPTESPTASPTVLFAGGGSGGHIFPNLAVIERLRERGVAFTPHLLVSTRPLDAEVARAAGVAFTALPAVGLGMKPKALWRWWRGYRAARKAVVGLMHDTGATTLLATGGFVSGPAAAAARKVGGRVGLVSLDASAGRANRHAAKFADATFNALPPHAGSPTLDDAETVGYPLRRSAIATLGKEAAREAMGLDPAKRTLLVFAGSQGARTINEAMRALVEGTGRGMLAGSQVLHITGGGEANDEERERLTEAYRAANVPAVLLPFCDAMGDAWAAADLGLTRCGAGTVAEAWANGVPCIMLPYPWHRDEHQKFNAAPLVDLSGAVVETDRIEPAENVEMLRRVMGRLFKDEATRSHMRHALRENPPEDGAEFLANWVAECVAQAAAMGAGPGG